MNNIQIYYHADCLIKSNGVKINNQPINNEKYIIDNQFFKKQGFVKLSLGKKRHFKIVN